uniref:Arginine vasopressin-induced protein 1 n=1 Tax=Periophthalmus magnuspinnatus TaxID=409849 RepID=A0A3B4A4H4_9GOBI
MESDRTYMPPSPVLVWMDSGAARKAGSANIFSSVHLWQLQRLFRAAGDQDAEQRAQLVWGRGDEAELAQALIALRARGQKRGLRSRGRDALGAHWIKAFNHLRYFLKGTSSGATRQERGIRDQERRNRRRGGRSRQIPPPHPALTQAYGVNGE